MSSRTPSAWLRYAGLALGVWLCGMGCQRDYIESTGIMPSGERRLKVNVEAAIATFEAERVEHPDDHRIIRLLVRGYEKREDWVAVVTLTTEAIRLQPREPSYFVKLGRARLRLADAGIQFQLEHRADITHGPASNNPVSLAET